LDRIDCGTDHGRRTRRHVLSCDQTNATIGNKTIQFLAIVFVLPLLLILGILGVLRTETIGPLIGVIVGYVLSGFGKE
jgi:hypothetical protein